MAYPYLDWNQDPYAPYETAHSEYITGYPPQLPSPELYPSNIFVNDYWDAQPASVYPLAPLLPNVGSQFSPFAYASAPLPPSNIDPRLLDQTLLGPPLTRSPEILSREPPFHTRSRIPSRRLPRARAAKKRNYRQGVTRTPKCLPEELNSEPLSKLAGSLPIELFDIDRFVHRPAEERVSYKHGRTKRPLNAFMLYRKTYHPCVSHIRKGLKNQSISEIVAFSWRKEDVDVKSRFETLAGVETKNHHEAFPDYRYVPNNSTCRGKKRVVDEHDEDELSDLDGMFDSASEASWMSRLDFSP